MKRKVIIILLIILGVMILPLPKKVSAEIEPRITIYEDSNTSYAVPAGQIPNGVTYNASTKTLTLNDYSCMSVYSEGMDLTIVLEGESVIRESIEHDNGNLTIRGNGSLTASEIEVHDGNLVIDGGMIHVLSESDGISVNNGDFEMNGGDLVIEADGKNLRYGIEIINGNFTLNEGILGIYGDYDDDKGQNAIFLKKEDTEKSQKIIIKEGMLEISGFSQAIPLSANISRFELRGGFISISNCSLGVTSDDGILNDNLQLILDSGSIIFRSPEDDNMHILFGIAISNDKELNNIVTFNKDNLIMEDSKYDFRVIEMGNNKGILIAEENADISTYEGIAKDISILAKKKTIEGNGTTYDKTKGIRIAASIEDFKELYINDQLLTEDEDYTLEEGSTIILLSDDYINSLGDGTYTYRAVFNTGIAEGTFIIGETPATGDNIYYSLLAFIISMIGLLSGRKLLKGTK